MPRTQSIKSFNCDVFFYINNFIVNDPGKFEKVIEEDKKKDKRPKKGKKGKKGDKSELSSAAASSIFTSVSAMQARSDGTLLDESDEEIGEDRESEADEERVSGNGDALEMKKKFEAKSTTSRKKKTKLKLFFFFFKLPFLSFTRMTM